MQLVLNNQLWRQQPRRRTVITKLAATYLVAMCLRDMSERSTISIPQPEYCARLSLEWYLGEFVYSCHDKGRTRAVNFLIDKNGICRSVTAREDFEKVIPQLLAEKSAI